MMMNRKNTPFLVGVNYWPRKSGVRMYQEFDAAEIDAEFAEIRAMNCNTVRVFLMWDEFQPIREFPSCMGDPHAIALRNNWNETEYNNPAMLDEAKLQMFDRVVASARKHDLRLIVALLTAWMSGTLFEPAFRNGRDYFADPFMLKFQMQFCRCVAKRYENDPAILCWEYGNEQNCVSRCAAPETAWVWLHALAQSIRQGDPRGKVSSGMHSLRYLTDKQNCWGIRDSADAVDLLTTHPYYEFTPGCAMESPLDLRASLHATAESLYYAGVGKRETLCEETGSLGRSVMSDATAAAFLRMRLWSLYCNGLKGCLWWCFSDFACTGELPYRDVQMENDGLGLTRLNGELKPAAVEMKEFAGMIAGLEQLPPRTIDAAILLPDRSEDFPTVLTTFALCKQAGIEAEFVALDEKVDLAKYRLLIAAGFNGHAPCSTVAAKRLLDAVEAGSVLYWSGDGPSVATSAELFGVDAMDKQPVRGTVSVRFSAGKELAVSALWRTRLEKFEGTPVLEFADGAPAATLCRRGKGQAVFCVAPLEESLSRTVNGLDDSIVAGFYRRLAGIAGLRHEVELDGDTLERTWHRVDASRTVFSVIHHGRSSFTGSLRCGRKVAAMRLLAGVGAELSAEGELSVAPCGVALVDIQFTVHP